VLYLARHECGTKICREKGIEYARRLLGHAEISTTQRSMHLDDRELAEAQDLVEQWLTVTALDSTSGGDYLGSARNALPAL
jgi:hypothetical protein